MGKKKNWGRHRVVMRRCEGKSRKKEKKKIKEGEGRHLFLNPPSLRRRKKWGCTRLSFEEYAGKSGKRRGGEEKLHDDCRFGALPRKKRGKGLPR